MSRSLTHEEFLKRLKLFNHDITPLTLYTNKRTKIKMKCNKCGYEWESNAENLLRGRGCPSCARKNTGEKHRLSHSKFISMLPETIEVLEEYTKYGVPIKCRCKVCGYEWTNKPEHLLKNKYCPQCVGLVRYTNETFKLLVKEKCTCIEVLGNYEEVGAHGNIQCKCTRCGYTWNAHVVALKRGLSCPICVAEELREKKKKTIDLFISLAEAVHENRYDYSKVLYITDKTPVTIICSEHGEFQQTPNSHLRGSGCPKCANERLGKLRRRTNDSFISLANKVHNNKYNYDKCEYKTKREKVIITCPIHGDFEQLAGNHLSGCGCPKCNSSKGEMLVISILTKYNILFKYQYTLKHTINNRKIIVDFICKYKDNEYVIEYNGILHYKPIEYFGGEEAFYLLKIRDENVRKLCNEYNVKLLEIPYYLSELEVEDKITNLFHIPKIILRST